MSRLHLTTVAAVTVAAAITATPAGAAWTAVTAPANGTEAARFTAAPEADGGLGVLFTTGRNSGAGATQTTSSVAFRHVDPGGAAGPVVPVAGAPAALRLVPGNKGPDGPHATALFQAVPAAGGLTALLGEVDGADDGAGVWSAPSGGASWTLAAKGAGGLGRMIAARDVAESTLQTPAGAYLVSLGKVWRLGAPAVSPFDRPDLADACSSRSPARLAQGAAGKLWAAWVVLPGITGPPPAGCTPGVRVQEVDPATGDPLGAAKTMPMPAGYRAGRDDLPTSVGIASTSGGVVVAGAFGLRPGGAPPRYTAVLWRIGDAKSTKVPITEGGLQPVVGFREVGGATTATPNPRGGATVLLQRPKGLVIVRTRKGTASPRVTYLAGPRGGLSEVALPYTLRAEAYLSGRRLLYVAALPRASAAGRPTGKSVVFVNRISA